MTFNWYYLYLLVKFNLKDSIGAFNSRHKFKTLKLYRQHFYVCKIHSQIFNFSLEYQINTWDVPKNNKCLRKMRN